jgi:hypothetical protein
MLIDMTLRAASKPVFHLQSRDESARDFRGSKASTIAMENLYNENTWRAVQSNVPSQKSSNPILDSRLFTNPQQYLTYAWRGRL